MVGRSERITIETVTEETDTRYGFTWVPVDGKYLLRSPDDRFREVPRVVVETLREEATSTSIEDLIAETAEMDADAAAVLREMSEEGFIREGAPVERVQPPADLRLWPRALGVGVLVVLAGALFVETVLSLAGPVAENPVSYLLGSVHVALPLILGSVAVHEYGHYRTARSQGLDPSIGVSVINGVLPAVVTRTHGGWALPRNRRMWNTLAGPAYGLVWTLGVFVAYYTVASHPGVAVAGVFCFNLQVVPLVPVFHGDGYLLLTDLLGQRNLRKRGIADLGSGRPSWAAAYVVFSYGFVAVQLAVGAVVGYLAGDVPGAVILVGLALILRADARFGLLDRLRETLADTDE